MLCYSTLGIEVSDLFKMANEVEITKDCLEVLSQASDLASKFTAVSKIIEFAGKLTSVFPIVGAVLGLAECFLPDGKHQEILRCFEKLSNKIDQVRNDIKELEEMIKWEFTQLQYGDVVSRIELGMLYCLEIGRAREKAEKVRYQERLKEVCANQSITLALNTLLDGIAGTSLFRNSILDEVYNKTKGDRPKVSGVATRLLQLVCGGMMVIATYETVIRGKEGSKEITKLYESRFREVNAKVQSVIARCQDNFREHMFNDLNDFLDTGRKNEDLLGDISHFMSDKYDWLEIFCLVYNDLYGLDKHCFNGDRVDSLHRNGKCGIVFYRTKGEPPRFSHRYDEAYKINDDVNCWDAQTGYTNIVDKLNASGIGWTGCAVIRRYPDLWYGGTFSTRNASIVGPNATAIILLK